MRPKVSPEIGSFVLGLFIVLAALNAQAYALVRVTLFSLSPDPVYIVAGDAVFWTDADRGGPYGIYADDGSWSTVTDTSGIQFNQTGTYGYYDDNGNTGTIYVTVNTPPTVAITNPANNAVLPAPATFTFSASASDTDSDGLSDVEFYVAGTLVDDIFSPPFTTQVTNLPAGNYTLTAIAYDNAGATATNSISITVGAAPSTNYIIAAACGDIYSSGTVDTGLYLDAGVNPRGGLEFASFNATIYSQILLALNPYGLPIYATNVSVYGFDGGTGTLYGSNYNAGTFLGNMYVPTSTGYGQIVTFDVTPFVLSTRGPYFGFVLHATGGGDEFSSLARNYGTPPELIAVLSTLPPALVARQVANQLVISWNTNNATGLSLQSTTNLASSTGWIPVTNTPSPVAGQLVVTNPIVGPRKFFRLSNH